MSTEQLNDDVFAAAIDKLDAETKQQKSSEQAMNAMTDARIKLVIGRDSQGRPDPKAVFFATVAMRLKLEVNWKVDTAATDGKRIVFNPDFINTLSKSQVVGLLVHEVMHVTNAHHARMGDRDPEQWNVAGDLAINPLIRDVGFDLPDGGLFPGESKYSQLAVGLSAEEYYHAMQQQQPPQPQKPKDGDQSAKGDQPDNQQGDKSDADGNDEQKDQPGNDPGGCGGVMKPGQGSPAECEQAEAEAKVMAAAAEAAAKSRGMLPEGLARNVEQLLRPVADWKAILREFVAQAARNDYSWTRPNRRFVHSGIYLPGMYSEELGDVVLAVDTSGSISPETLATFANEMQGILDAYACRLTILYHTTEVYAEQEWSSTDGPLVLEGTHSGGTSHRDVFDKIDRDGLDPKVIVCLTDLYTDFPQRGPDAPVLWCVVGNRKPSAPFGVVLDIDEK